MSKDFPSEAKVRELSEGEYFCFVSHDWQEVSGHFVWVRGQYDRASRKYEIHRFDDVNNSRFVAGSKIVFLDFEF